MRNSAVLVVVLILCVACASAPPVADATASEPATKTIYLIHNGWHSGVIVQASDLPSNVLPERADFPKARYLEIGWGDRDFYQARGIGVWMSLKAAFVPTASVVHIVGFNAPVTEFFSSSNLVEFKLSSTAMDRLARHIHDSLERQGTNERVPALGPGLYGTSKFYPATGSFHMFNTCHTWTAGTMRAAGFPFSARPTESGLLSQAQRLGRPLQTAKADR